MRQRLKATSDELIAYCKANLVRYEVPKCVEFGDDLPKSAICKLFRRVIRRMELVKGETSGER
jgi:long-chain acyl-CoA synthetase